MNIKISIRVIALFTIAILFSYLGDYLSPYFGDWYCQGRKWAGSDLIGCDVSYCGASHNPKSHWGYRHYLFFLMGFSLFIIQVIDIISNLENNEK